MKHYSIAEYAKMLGVTRVAVWKRIKSGKLKAVKVGRAYIISQSVAVKDQAARLAAKKTK